MSNNDELLRIMERVNTTAKNYGFVNGKEWAQAAQNKGDISYYTYKDYIECHNLRNMLGHPGSTRINVSDSTISNAHDFLSDIRSSNLRKQRKQVTLPKGTFRANPYVKEFHWKGYEGRSYDFRFHIVKEHQKRAYDDGTRFEGFGYTIYVKEAPYKNWCLEHNSEYEFHYYAAPINNPSICWNTLIENFSEANAVMYEWASRYTKILDRLLRNKSIDERKLNQASRRRGILPTGTFRYKNEQKTIYIAKSVYDEILNILGKRKPELGGMLGWSDDQDYIDTFVFDAKAKVGNAEYNPNTEYLMSVMDGEWVKEDIYLAGFVHSHPRDCNQLSYADIEYAQRIMKAFDMKYIFMPIITSSFAYKTTFNPYIVTISGKVKRCKIEVYDDACDNVDIDESSLAKIRAGFDKMSKVNPLYEENKSVNLDQNSTFARVSSVIDINYMKDCSVIGVGCGGARGFYEDMARMGIGNFYLIDGDISSRSNIASQNGYISEIGKPKVEVVKKRLLDINDACNVEAYNFMLDDSVSDDWFYNNILKNHKPKKTIICAFTDDFFAQARTQKLAKKYNIPYLSAQHHEFGNTSEVIYWYPSVSKYSAEEILRDRYASYANGYKNDVTSVGSPIFNTTRLNALCEKIALGVLLYDKEKESSGNYSNFIKFNPERNLILIRQKDLSFSNSTLLGAFVENELLCFDDVAWIDIDELEWE